ncbi:carbohydrate sulfotransferase 14-like [Saccostrea echinata]|uniref:carbohydrate sulfotransferase 14-like n=1 Tax=Saccostrea echinata TaxID=191078 RepID=UPI002A82D56B|nr:carbohydrate sulfotransferase 14-like [Saccostrea echinata]
MIGRYTNYVFSAPPIIQQPKDTDNSGDGNKAHTGDIFKITKNFVQEKRQDSIRRSCLHSYSNYSSQSFLDKLNKNIALYTPMGFLYCRIQKSGSTFLREIMKQFFEGMFQLELQGHKMLVNRSEDFITCLAKSSKFMFVREPFSRALSGYVDKLFAPNPGYWKGLGRHIVKTVRGLKSSHKSLRCGHDVTFPEFMKYVVISQKTLKHRDRHFYPMYEHCYPCGIKYDFIGKMETFREDVTLLLDSFNSTFSVKKPRADFELAPDLSIVESQIKRAFNFKSETQLCEPFHKSLKRVWRLLQISGVLPLEVQMPFSVEKTKHISYSEVLDKIKGIMQSIQNRTKLKEQRLEAKEEAYSLISTDMLKEFIKLYRFDFEFFDYTTNPSFIKTRIFASFSKELKYFNIFN